MKEAGRTTVRILCRIRLIAGLIRQSHCSLLADLDGSEAEVIDI